MPKDYMHGQLKYKYSVFFRKWYKGPQNLYRDPKIVWLGVPGTPRLKARGKALMYNVLSCILRACTFIKWRWKVSARNSPLAFCLGNVARFRMLPDPQFQLATLGAAAWFLMFYVIAGVISCVYHFRYVITRVGSLRADARAVLMRFVGVFACGFT